MVKETVPYWKTKTLEEMNDDEWELLCDGCARCCQIKLEDDDDGEIYYTQLVCRLLDLDSCQCTEYETRSKLVPTCVSMKAKDVRNIKWMPDTCAYRLLAEGKDLPEWHPLISKDKYSVIDANISVRGNVIPEYKVPEDEWEYYVTDKHE